MSRGHPLYSVESLTWFDSNWEAGVTAEKIVLGMQLRGYDMDQKKATHLASRRGLYRPPHFQGKGGDVSQEQMMVRYLLNDRQRGSADNPVVKPETRYRYEGGFSMLGGRAR